MSARILPERTSKKRRDSALLAPGSIGAIKTKALIIPRGCTEALPEWSCGLERSEANLEGTLFQRIRLLQEICFKIEHFVAEPGPPGISGRRTGASYPAVVR